MNARLAMLGASALLACTAGTGRDQAPVRSSVRTAVPACGYRSAATVAARTTACMSAPEPPPAAPVLLAGRGTPSVDGALSPGEWDGEAPFLITANLPASVGGGTAPAELRFLHDDRNLYVSFRVLHPLPSGTIFGTSLGLEFDRDCSGGLSPGDDGIGTSLGYRWPGYESTFGDTYRWSCGCGLCSSYDTADSTCMSGPAGTSDGAGAGGGDATSIVLEMSHPLASGDLAHDFQLAPGDAIPFLASFRIIERSNDWPYGFGDTDLPTYGPLPIVALGDGAALRCPGAEPVPVTPPLPPEPPPPDEPPPPPPEDPPPPAPEEPPPPPAPLRIRIDVLPGSDENPVNAGQPGTIPVAILGDAGFDATAVDATTVRFAGALVARTPEGKLIGFPEDVDGDGVLDLVLHFDVPSLSLAPGATAARLEGLTCAGAAFAGSDAVRVVPP